MNASSILPLFPRPLAVFAVRVVRVSSGLRAAVKLAARLDHSAERTLPVRSRGETISVLLHVIPLIREQFEVVGSVVEPVSVTVMDHFTPQQRPAEVLLHDVTMLHHEAPIDADHTIPVRADAAALVGVMAFALAVLTLALPRTAVALPLPQWAVANGAGSIRIKDIGHSTSIINRFRESVKDRLENVLHQRVCTGEESLTDAQAEIRGDWTVAYVRYLGEPAGAQEKP
jgi:hypothetical protein